MTTAVEKKQKKKLAMLKKIAMLKKEGAILKKKLAMLNKEQAMFEKEQAMLDTPSKITDTPWVVTSSKKDLKHKRKYKTEDIYKEGKWLLFVHINELDETWQIIKKATEKGLLGPGSKTATARPSKQAKDDNIKVICIYTYNWKDEEDVFRVEKALRSLNIHNDLYYKTDEDTAKNKYQVSGDTNISKYIRSSPLAYCFNYKQYLAWANANIDENTRRTTLQNYAHAISFDYGLIADYQKKYKGLTLSQHFKGKTTKNKFGEFYLISNKTAIKPVIHDRQGITQKLLTDLKVIPGISEITEKQLKSKGKNSIVDLTYYLKFEREASYYLRVIKENNVPRIYDYLSNSTLSSSNPLLLLTSALFDLEEIVFIDIETLGLRGCPLFLIGVATIKNNNIIVNQILARDLNEEKAALYFLSEYLKDKKAICSFNGKSFDIPFINNRLKTHNIRYEVSHPHYDIRYFAARAYKNSFEDFRLTTLESKLFQTQREEDIPSSVVPEFYKLYVRTNNIGTIVPVINHNKQDLISTVNIFIKLHEIWN